MVEGSRFWVPFVGFRVEVGPRHLSIMSEFRVGGLGFGVWGLGFRAWGLGFRVGV